MRGAALLPCLLLAACAAPGPSPAARGAAVSAIDVSEADAGKAIAARPGQTVAVHLDENPLTGYRWQLDLQPAGPWQLVGGSFAPPAPGRPGAGGSRTWLLRAAHAGQARLSFVLQRPWGERDTSRRLAFDLVAQ